MKIGFFTDSYKPYLSGVVKSIESFTTELRKQGHCVYIFAPDYPEVKKQENEYRFVSLPVPTNTDFRLAIPLSKKILPEIRRLNLDIIHTHSPFLMGRLGRYIARKLNIPLVFTYHTLYDQYIHYVPIARRLARRLTIKYCRDYSQSCDLIITPTDFVQQVLWDHKIVTKMLTVPTGINLRAYRFDSEKQQEKIKRKYGIADKERVLLFVGRLGEEKNVSFLLKSYKYIVDSLFDTRLVIVGDGPQKAWLKRLAEELHIADNVVFTGKQESERVVYFYQLADLLLFPSITETQGLVTLEAMAGGAPVIAIDAAGSSSMIDNGVNGILVKGDKNLFAQATIELLTNEMKYRIMKKNALKKAEELSINKMTQRLLHAYQGLLSNRVNVCNI